MSIQVMVHFERSFEYCFAYTLVSLGFRVVWSSLLDIVPRGFILFEIRNRERDLRVLARYFRTISGVQQHVHLQALPVRRLAFCAAVACVCVIINPTPGWRHVVAMRSRVRHTNTDGRRRRGRLRGEATHSGGKLGLGDPSHAATDQSRCSFAEARRNS